MTTVTLFKNHNGNVGVALHLRDGSVQTVPFVSGKFFTTVKKLADALQEAADNAEFGIYVDPNEPDIDPECATPMDQMKRKLREEVLAEMRAEGLLIKDAGVSSQATIQGSLATSADVVGATEPTAAEQALKQKQIDEMAKPTVANKTLSTAELLAKTNKPT